MTNVRLEVKGLKELQKQMIDRVKALEGGPMLKAMQKATLLVTADAKRLAPVDTGRLRASIIPTVERKSLFDNRVRGIVGSNVEYAPYQELGTVYMKGKFYLAKALAKNAERIALLLRGAVARIIKKGE